MRPYFLLSIPIRYILDRIDLIYEGIATFLVSIYSAHLLYLDRIDLIYEGIATPHSSSKITSPSHRRQN
ncbi:hypothetical cytosolic protein [Syntrophus aciditrophicus SB]|uniref:Hypothetical cytosolic protein n=1 Tax=Syntrophus aciditrophicus (strain SB) TaxID=56780 RepID=Q2LQW7_SYNAS|nr:hypothetical cytosolic protein [Syntrophus aciditrophicus SB]